MAHRVHLDPMNDTFSTGANAQERTKMLERQALAWLRRLSLSKATSADVQEFERWIGASEENRKAYRSAKSLWDVLSPVTAALAAANPNMVANYERSQRVRTYTRRTFFGMAGASMAAVGVAAVVYPPFGAWQSPLGVQADYRTATGEQRTLALSEGVSMTLNTHSSARRDLVAGRLVGLDLLEGEAALDVRAGYRFAVRAGAGRSEAEAGKFEVKYVDGAGKSGEKICVTCIDGKVNVRHPAATRALSAGQQATYDDRAIGDVTLVDAEAVSAWRRGLIIVHQARLSGVIDEINRYRPGRVVLMNASVKNRMVSGVFSISDPDNAVAQIKYMFGLQSRSLGNMVVLS